MTCAGEKCEWLTELYLRRRDLQALFECGELAVMQRVVELEAQVKSKIPIGDSRTSHAAPSSDPRSKARSLRKKSSRKPGGQVGHVGHRLVPVATPDAVVVHAVVVCSGCGYDVRGRAAIRVTKKQVFELPKSPLVVTEHQLESKRCPCCAVVTTAVAPAGAEQLTQYGPRLAGLATYLHVYHFLPLARTADVIEVICGRRVSDGWIAACQTRVSGTLDPFLKAVTAGLRKAPVICCDESGFRFAGKRFWLHVCCTATLTLLLCHRRRGLEGTAALGVLPGYQGTAVHDHWPAYFQIDSCRHAVCNEHHARELDGVTQRDDQPWAEALKIVLYDGLELKRRHHDHGTHIPPKKITDITNRYKRCLRDGYAVTPPPPPPTNPKRGRPKRGKTLALLDRLRDRQHETLRFLHDPNVPWSNNQAERDIRPMKTQQKITGGFRTEAGAVEFCRVRSYLSTTTKNGIDPCDAIAKALAGRPWRPKVPRKKPSRKRTAA